MNVSIQPDKILVTPEIKSQNKSLLIRTLARAFNKHYPRDSQPTGHGTVCGNLNLVALLSAVHVHSMRTPLF